MLHCHHDDVRKYSRHICIIDSSLNCSNCFCFQADATLEMEQRDFARAALEYVCLIQEVQERKKFEFVETVSQSGDRRSVVMVMR